MSDILIDIEAESISREVYMFAPIYRVRFTDEQYQKLKEEIMKEDKFDEYMNAGDYIRDKYSFEEYKRLGIKNLYPQLKKKKEKESR